MLQRYRHFALTSVIAIGLTLGILTVSVLCVLLVFVFRRIEKESRFTQDFLDAVFENHPDMMLVKDARDLRYVRVNKAARRLLGHSGKILGKLDQECFPKAQAAFFSAKDQEVLELCRPRDIQPTFRASGPAFSSILSPRNMLF